MSVNFQNIKYFDPKSLVDNWGLAAKISRDLLLKLDEFRDRTGMPVIVTSGFRLGDKGQHGLGTAADIVVPNWSASVLDLFFLAERIGFKGIGVYPDWQYGGKVVGGLHLDVRAGNTARWIGYRPNGPGTPNSYLPLNSHNIQMLPGIL